MQLQPVSYLTSQVERALKSVSNGSPSLMRRHYLRFLLPLLEIRLTLMDTKLHNKKLRTTAKSSSSSITLCQPSRIWEWTSCSVMWLSVCQQSPLTARKIHSHYAIRRKIQMHAAVLEVVEQQAPMEHAHVEYKCSDDVLLIA